MGGGREAACFTLEAGGIHEGGGVMGVYEAMLGGRWTVWMMADGQGLGAIRFLGWSRPPELGWTGGDLAGEASYQPALALGASATPTWTVATTQGPGEDFPVWNAGGFGTTSC